MGEAMPRARREKEEGMVEGESKAPPTKRSFEVGLVVRDLEKMTTFYRDGLGLGDFTDSTSPRGVNRRFRCGDGVIKLHGGVIPPDKANPPGGMDNPCSGLRWITLFFDDLTSVVARCEALGGTSPVPVFEFAPGRWGGVIEDPEGNCWIEIVKP